jgi:pimeloyl-ACP methyl ester carboxylesterase
MPTAELGGITLQYRSEGVGPPVVLVHGSVIAGGLSPLLSAAILTKNNTLVSYDRRGYGGSTHPTSGFTIRDEAMDCARLLRHLRYKRAHLVGHSYGGLIALQLALDEPKVVQSLSLLEPALLCVIPTGSQFLKGLLPAVDMYRRGDRSGALNFFMGPMGELSEPMDSALRDIGTLFDVEYGEVERWRFTREEAKHIKMPVLSVRGGASSYPSKQIDDVLREWIPQIESVAVPGATHEIHSTNLDYLSEQLRRFLDAHG